MYKSIRTLISGAVLATGLAVIPSQASAEEVEVFMMGDSMMKSVGRSMKKKLKAEGVSADYFASIGSGLARMDLFDWATKTDEIAALKPAKAVVFVGANDNQPMDTGLDTVAFGTDAWSAEYSKRCSAIMDTLIKSGTKQILWVGMPCMRDANLDRDVKKINDAIQQAVSTHPQVTYVPTYDTFSKNGAYSAYVVQPSGIPLDVRESDGVHLNRQGADFLAATLISKLK